MKKLRVAVIYGGRSGEHEVSLVSARSILKALDKKKYAPVPILIGKDGAWSRGLKGVDVAFPIVHGTYGEDGRLQGALEMAGIPYVGCDVAASAVCMDKDLTKRLLKEAGIPVAAGFVMRRGDPVPNVACYPVFVKPARLGSSVGISKVKNRQGLKAAVRAAFRYDDKILIEQAVPDAREIECAVLGNGPYRVSEFGEIIPSGEFYDFNSKYVDGASSCLLPAPIPKTLTKTLQAAARRACRVLGIEGLARIDFLVSRKTGEWVLNEPNTLPGFTSISMYPKLWLRQGLTYPHLIDTLIRLALERGRRRARLTTDFSSGSDWYVA